jgi:hypothetical protein
MKIALNLEKWIIGYLLDEGRDRGEPRFTSAFERKAAGGMKLSLGDCPLVEPANDARRVWTAQPL